MLSFGKFSLRVGLVRTRMLLFWLYIRRYEQDVINGKFYIFETYHERKKGWWVPGVKRIRKVAEVFRRRQWRTKF
jgi:hypothetical protein